MRYFITAPINKNTQIAPDIYALTFMAPDIASIATPGQFVQVRCTNGVAPLLRRPFSIHDVAADGGVTILYRIIGNGTRALAKLPPGQALDVIGPLGRGFALTGEKPLLVGGGIGVAPLFYLAKTLAPRPVTALVGSRTATDAPLAALFAPVCREVALTTDDGSAGYQGMVTDFLPQVLANSGGDVVYACGPRAMLLRVISLAQQAGVPCQVSLEQFMGCGVGLCRGCTCEMLKNHQAKVCQDGPVFSGEEVIYRG